MDPPSKKPRVARPTSAYVPKSERMATAAVVSGPHEATATASLPRSSATVNEEPKAPPNFAPWDRGQFLERLRSYRHVDKWTGKPDRINEVEWAKRGWSCVGKDRVGCVGGCLKEVVIKLESAREDREMQEVEQPVQEEEDGEDYDWREKAQEQLVEKYAEMIAKSHDGGCLWRRRGCDGEKSFCTLWYHALINDCRHHTSTSFSTPRNCHKWLTAAVLILDCYGLRSPSNPFGARIF